MSWIKTKRIEVVFGLAVMSIVLAVAFSCNRTFPDEAHRLKDNYPNNGGGTAGAKKILYLILDGAEGKEVKTLKPPNLMSLLSTSVYSWYGISGVNPGDATLPSAWTSMMTGVGSNKNQVVENFDNANLSNYPTFITRIKQAKPTVRITGYAASALFSEKLLKDADINKLTENDDVQVKQNVVENLKNDSANIVVGQFHSIAIAGDQYGYSSSASEYSSAVATVDGYIGEVVSALRDRPAYKSENWLIIVASNENGAINKNAGQDSTSAFNDSRLNSFIIISSPRFSSSQEVNGAGVPGTAGFVNFEDSALKLVGQGFGGVRISGNDTKHVYDLVKGSEHTLEFKLKVPGGGYSAPTGSSSSQGFHNLFGTFNAWNESAGGWAMAMCAGWCGNTRVDINFVSPTLSSTNYNAEYDKANYLSTRPGDDGQWHNIVLTMKWPIDEQRIYFKLYMDGVLQKANFDNFSPQPDFNNPTTDPTFFVPGNGTIIPSRGKFFIGPPINAGQYLNLFSNSGSYITDFRYWNAAFNATDVAKYSCKTDIPADHPYLDKLAAYYKMSDTTGNVITDLSPNKQDAFITDGSKSKTLGFFSETSRGICPEPSKQFYSATINGLDLPFQILQWVGINIAESWNLDGKYWTSKYADVVVP